MARAGPSKVAKNPSPAVSLLAAEARQLTPHQRVVLGEEIAPPTVAQGARALGRADEIGEQHGREDALGHLRCGLCGEEAVDLVGDVQGRKIPK
jgi:hypothetical protein